MFLAITMVLWLCKRMCLFLGDIYWNIKGYSAMTIATYFQVVQKNISVYTNTFTEKANIAIC